MIEKKAYAKINLVLHIKGKRTDGMHEVDMIMTPLELADKLTFQALTTKEISLYGAERLGGMTDNLIYRAATLLQTETNTAMGATISLEKKIPVAAGLGGGSSDAAATLLALNELWDLELPMGVLANYALQLGADVPYCLYHQTMRAEGIGEKLTKLPPMPLLRVLLFQPSYGISTKEAYAAVGTYPATAINVIAMQQALEAQDLKALYQSVGNSFEGVTYQQHPDLRLLKKELQQFSECVMLSGSGPVMFALVTNPQYVDEMIACGTSHNFIVYQTETKIHE